MFWFLLCNEGGRKKKTLQKLIIMVIFNKVTLNPFTSRLASYGEIILSLPFACVDKNL